MNSGYKNKWEKYIDILSSEESCDEILGHHSISDEDKVIFDVIRGIRLYDDREQCNSLKAEIQSMMYDKMFSDSCHKEKTFGGFTRLNLLLSVVASVALVICGLSIFHNNDIKDDCLAMTPVIFSATQGMSKVILPDSSSVMLNSGSTLSYIPYDFNREDRTVRLEGEALFDVYPDKDKAFIVSSGDIKIRVLGTKFNVRDYSDEDDVVVSLLSGSVSIDNKENKPICSLEPLREAIFNKNDQSLKVEPFDPINVAGWTQGELNFRQTTVSELCRVLERRFHCTVIIKDKKMNDRIVTGRFVDNESLTEILDILKISFAIHYKIEDNIITIY